MIKIAAAEREEILAALAELAFFQEWEHAALRKLVASRDLCQFQGFRMGEFLIHQHEAGSGLYILLAGRASVVHGSDSVPLATLIPGQFFGEVGFFTNRPRSSNVIVHGPGDVEPDAAERRLRRALGLEEIPRRDADDLAVALRLERALLSSGGLDAATLDRMMDRVTGVLVERLDRMNDRIIELTGEEALLSIDADLEALLAEASRAARRGDRAARRGDGDGPLAEIERQAIKTRLIDQLALCQEEMNELLAHAEIERS